MRTKPGKKLTRIEELFRDRIPVKHRCLEVFMALAEAAGVPKKPAEERWRLSVTLAETISGKGA